MNAKKFWATLVCALFLVSIVLTVPSSSPAYAQAKTHLGVSPADMVTLFYVNQDDYELHTFKRINPNTSYSDFDAVPEGKILIITDISVIASDPLPEGFLVILWNLIVPDDGVMVYSCPYQCNLTGLRNHQFSFTSGLTFYPQTKPEVHTNAWLASGKLKVYLYGYLIDAPPVPKLRPPGPPLNPPFPPFKPPIDK